jgi:hypothetical protein
MAPSCASLFRGLYNSTALPLQYHFVPIAVLNTVKRSQLAKLQAKKLHTVQQSGIYRDLLACPIPKAGYRRTMFY